MKLKLSALAALAVTFFAVPAAEATLTYASGDLFIAFHQDGNTNFEYMINVGAAANYRDANSTITLALGTAFDNDMKLAFGNSWKTVGNISWGIFGTTQNSAMNGDPIRLLYVSEPTGSSVPVSSSGLATPAGLMIGVKNNWGSTGTSTGVERTVPNSATVDPTGSNSFTTQVTNNSVGPFNYPNIAPLEGSISGVMDFYRVPQTGAQQTGNNFTQNITLEGQFLLSTVNNSISFVPTPEPTSAALFAMSLTSFMGFRRLRRRALQE